MRISFSYVSEFMWKNGCYVKGVRSYELPSPIHVKSIIRRVLAFAGSNFGVTHNPEQAAAGAHRLAYRLPAFRNARSCGNRVHWLPASTQICCLRLRNANCKKQKISWLLIVIDVLEDAHEEKG